jgi:two-component system chemotaxis sensor kinase CheA
LLPIVRFREVLSRTQTFTAETKAELLRKYNPANRDPAVIEYIVVLRSRGRRFGLLVDEVRGTQEVVVKPMHPTLKRLGVFAGATLMGDGRVALIPNVDGIVEHANCFGSEAPTDVVKADARDPVELHRILIFECGPREQFALPLVQIRRIESIDTSRIQYVDDQEFVTLDGVATRIVRLDRVLRVTPCSQQQAMYLVLPKFVPEPMGILISRIVDTDSLAIELQRATVADPGILGTAIVRGRLSLFLDVQYIREQVFGHAAASPPDALPAAPAGQRRVLLIDDTPFFRQLVQRYLESAGITVTTATDGQDGLHKLASGQFDLIVCDIEMPNLDGWGFARAARERECRLPMLALTSLSKTDHEARARSCGFDEFQEKLDRDQLLRTVNRLLSQPISPAGRGVRAAPASGVVAELTRVGAV